MPGRSSDFRITAPPPLPGSRQWDTWGFAPRSQRRYRVGLSPTSLLISRTRPACYTVVKPRHLHNITTAVNPWKGVTSSIFGWHAWRCLPPSCRRGFRATPDQCPVWRDRLTFPASPRVTVKLKSAIINRVRPSLDIFPFPRVILYPEKEGGGKPPCKGR